MDPPGRAHILHIPMVLHCRIIYANELDKFIKIISIDECIICMLAIIKTYALFNCSVEYVNFCIEFDCEI